MATNNNVPKEMLVKILEIISSGRLINGIDFLKCFPIEDLVKIVENDNDLLPLARIAFEEKFKNIGNEITNELQPGERNDEPFAIKLLKNFGGHIRKLKLTFNDDYQELNSIIEEAIINYGDDSIDELILDENQ